MPETHVMSALLAKWAELAGRIEHEQTVLRQSIIDLDNLDAAIRIFDSDMDLENVKPKPFPPRATAFKGEVVRIVLGTPREANEPLPTAEIARHVIAVRGLNTADKPLVKAMGKRVNLCLRHHRKAGLVRSLKGEGRRHSGYGSWQRKLVKFHSLDL